MIDLTTLGKEKFTLNCDLIYKIVDAPDTIITLTDGKVMRVAESKDEIVTKIIEFRRRIYVGEAGGEK